MGRQEPILTQEEVHEGFLVEAYTEEEVVASTALAYSPNGTNLNVDSQEIEICSQQVRNCTYISPNLLCELLSLDLSIF